MDKLYNLDQWFPNFSVARTTLNIKAQNIDLYRDHQWSAEQTLGITDQDFCFVIRHGTGQSVGGGYTLQPVFAFASTMSIGDQQIF